MLARLYFLGPELFRIYRNFERSERYNPNTFEHYGSKIIFCMTLAYNVGFYFVTPWLSYQILFKRGEFFQPATLQQGFRYLTGIGFVYMVAVTLRAFGRATNPVYKEFLLVLDKAVKEPTQSNKVKLQQFDSGIGPWPIDFSMKDGKPAGKRLYLERGSVVGDIFSIPNRVVAWLMTHSFGLKLVYPGSIKLLQASLGDALVDGRAKWFLEKAGRRHKLETIDSNQIDSMFFDRRETGNPNGKILVITCEGNAGFYEIGFLGSPLDAGFSVLGWNQPGFAESSGSPFPSQTTNAMDAVVQFAIQKLKFTPEQIIFHGWSIGGFPVSWAAMNYPDVKAVFLDATFDNLKPLATARMPQSLEALVSTAIEVYMNLNVIDHLVKYDGPIKLIRRSHDEIITTNSGHRGTNRGNDLLVGLLRHRYPEVVGEDEEKLLLEYLTHDEAGQSNILALKGVHESQMMDLLQTHADDNNGSSRTYPSTLGLDMKPETKAKLTLFLASRYMTDYDAVHCAALPAQLFTLPWEPPAPNHNDFVKI